MKKILSLFIALIILEGCSLTRDSGILNYKAVGQEPPWRTIIRNDSLIFIYGYERDTTAFRNFEHGYAENKIIFNAKKPGSSIKVILTEEQCMDIMSGQKYQYRAEVKKDTLTLSGCAEEVQTDSIKRKE